MPKELAIEFQVDTGYPAPTNANYIDTNAITIARRWGTVMDPIRLGRGADNSYPGCYYTNVVQTNSNGAFKVYLQFPNQAKSIQPGALWNMISRWNGSTVFNTYLSYQVTWMNNTNYAGAGISYGEVFAAGVRNQRPDSARPSAAGCHRAAAANLERRWWHLR